MNQSLHALYFTIHDPRTPSYAKYLIVVIVAYALSPIDLIPDFIPVLGYLDDLILLPIGIYLAIRLIPDDLWHESLIKARKSHPDLPKNKKAALFIIIFWLLILVATAVYVGNRYGSGEYPEA